MPSQNTKPADYPQAVLQQIALLAQNIVIARKRRKETQAQWAQRLGVSQPTMARIERGDPSVSMASYVMCMWLINQAQGLADLIAPQNDLTSLELEVAKARPRRAAQTTAQKDAKTAASNAKPAALPSVSKTNAPAHLGTVHVAEAVKGSFEGASPDKPTIGAALKVTGLGPEEQIRQAIRVTGLGAPKRQPNSTAAGLAALIAGQKKARP